MSNKEVALATLNQLRSTTKVYKKACAQVSLLNKKIESAKTRMNRARSVKRLSNAKCLEASQLETVRNLIFAHAAINLRGMTLLSIPQIHLSILQAEMTCRLRRQIISAYNIDFTERANDQI